MDAVLLCEHADDPGLHGQADSYQCSDCTSLSSSGACIKKYPRIYIVIEQGFSFLYT